MKLPTHPKTCAWPCACSHAGEMEATLSRPLICKRFQTPRNVPGKTMKIKPVVTNAMSSWDNAASRARVTSKSCAWESADAGGSAGDESVAVSEVAKTRLRPRPSLFRVPPREERECCFQDARARAVLPQTV